MKTFPRKIQALQPGDLVDIDSCQQLRERFALSSIFLAHPFAAVQSVHQESSSRVVVIYQNLGRFDYEPDAEVLVDVSRLMGAGYKVHFGGADEDPSLAGRWWWTLHKDGWIDVATSDGEFSSEAEAWADASKDMEQAEDHTV
jgi:hypothetical protein